jgi:hypothetical protein
MEHPWLHGNRPGATGKPASGTRAPPASSYSDRKRARRRAAALASEEDGADEAQRADELGGVARTRAREPCATWVEETGAIVPAVDPLALRGKGRGRRHELLCSADLVLREELRRRRDGGCESDIEGGQETLAAGD